MNTVSPNIIDNSQDKKLVNVIKDQLRKSNEAKFAIGYFFLSGFNLVKNDFPIDLKKKPFLKLIMGNETTFPTKTELTKGYALKEIMKQKMIEDLHETELTEEQINQLKTLKEFIAKNIIDVKLFEHSRLHAKLYLFLTNPNETYGSPGLAVVGSSNFTAKGITENKELNVLLTSREDVIYLNEWFDKLWEESIEFREDLLKVIDLSGVLPDSPYPTIGKLIDPETLFKYLVYEWFEGRVLNLMKTDILMEFQLVGVVNAINIMNFYNGVILADSVGLGKSFMAAAIIEEFLNNMHPTWLRENKIPAVLLILPPSIIPQWIKLLIDSYYFFTNNITRIIKNNRSYRVYEVYDMHGKTLLGTLGFLSIGNFQNMKEKELKTLAEEYDLYVIDEVHKYRNKHTNRWKNTRALQKKQDGFPNKFLLLTATPLNNSINDIFNLIRLFTDDTFTSFRIKNIPIIELMKKYNDLKKSIQKKDDDKLKKELKVIATNIKQNVLDEIMVLRTRKYIMEQFKDLNINGKPIIFKDPKPHSLDYSPFSMTNYKKLIEIIRKNIEQIMFEYTKLYGTRYIVFEEETIDDNNEKRHYVEIADILKLLLGKRLESGLYSFETTLKRIYEKEKIFYEHFKQHINSILSRDDLRKLILESVNNARINKELEEIQSEYDIEEEDNKETWFDRVIHLLLTYADRMNENVHDPDKNDIERLRIGIKLSLRNLENDLRAMDAIFFKLNQLKNQENGAFKTLGKIPTQHEDIIDIPVYSYSNDPKLESLKQILVSPSSKSKILEHIPSLHGKKILIFTQYRDTAYYLYYNLKEWIRKEPSLHMWLKDTKKNLFKLGIVVGGMDINNKVNIIKRFAPQANNGLDEVRKHGEIHILISTDALSEGVNLQDADAVINYDLPWNPMVIVQRVGRVNRIGNERDVLVINFIPSSEVEVIVGVLRTLQEKIKDITLIVGKDVKILTPEEEISIETFGEKIIDLSQRSVTDLEEYGISDDFKYLIPQGIPSKQLDEYKLLNFIQYDLHYTAEDFEPVKQMKKNTYYTFIEGSDKVISFYEFYRGKYRILKQIISTSRNGEIVYETPLVFLDLINKKQKSPHYIENAIEYLKKIQDKNKKTIEELKEKYRQEQKGFLYHLYNTLLVERTKIKDKKTFKIVMMSLQSVPYYLYSHNVKSLLITQGLINVNKNNITINDYEQTINVLHDFFKEKGLTSIDSLKIKVKHVGWYYEI